MAIEDYKTMVVLNARRGQLYMQIFDDKQALTTPAMLSYSDTLSNINDNKFLIIGDGTIFLQEKIANSDSQVIPELVRVDAKWVAFAAEKKYLSGCKAMIAPCYIREADAQIPIK
jgi:tRNA A37 threonylcarbamoyladenosine modification protein TsaB